MTREELRTELTSSMEHRRAQLLELRRQHPFWGEDQTGEELRRALEEYELSLFRLSTFGRRYRSKGHGLLENDSARR